MDGYRRSEQEEIFEQLCQNVDADEAHEQEAIEFFEEHMDHEAFDAAQWLDVALYYSLAVARGVIDLVPAEDRARSTIAQVITDNLDISYSDDECRKFAEVLQLCLANGVPVDLEVVMDGCQRTLDDMEEWARDDDKAPLIRLREELLRMRDDSASEGD